MGPLPSIDPGASLTPYQVHVVATIAWATDAIRLSFLGVITGLALVIFLMAIVAVAVSLRLR
jgi:hypothetical protein